MLIADYAIEFNDHCTVSISTTRRGTHEVRAMNKTTGRSSVYKYANSMLDEAINKYNELKKARSL